MSNTKTKKSVLNTIVLFLFYDFLAEESGLPIENYTQSGRKKLKNFIHKLSWLFSPVIFHIFLEYLSSHDTYKYMKGLFQLMKEAGSQFSPTHPATTSLYSVRCTLTVLFLSNSFLAFLNNVPNTNTCSGLGFISASTQLS